MSTSFATSPTSNSGPTIAVTSSRLRSGIGEEGAVGLPHHAGGSFLIVLVGDLADDLLDDVLDRNDAIGAAVFIDDEGNRIWVVCIFASRSSTGIEGGP